MNGSSNIWSGRNLKASEGVYWRPAVLQDIGLLRNIESLCFPQEDRFHDHQFKHLIRNPNKTILSDIITIQGHDAGWACFLSRKGSSSIRLYSMAILPAFSGKGYASEYLSQRFKTFEGFKSVVLEVRVTNEKAIRLYEKLGFKIIRNLPEYYPDHIDGYKMAKPLGFN